jgi:hypothetical protein
VSTCASSGTARASGPPCAGGSVALLRRVAASRVILILGAPDSLTCSVALFIKRHLTEP